MLRRPELYMLPASLPWLKIGASIFDPDYGVSNFTPFQASLAARAFKDIGGINARRAAKADLYSRELQKIPLAAPVLPQPGSRPIYLRYPVLPAPELRLPAADGLSLHQALPEKKSRRLGLSPGFPLALCDIPDLAPHLDLDGQNYPGARFLARNLVTLPTHDQVRLPDSLAAAACLAEALSSLATSAPAARRPATARRTT
jgi:dTDP-4-amino-4,6-dideoxygalactose transaminase